MIISALWQYIKTHKLQDQHEKEFVNCDPFLKQIFQVIVIIKCIFPVRVKHIFCTFIMEIQVKANIIQTERMKFAEIPQRLNPLLHPPDPIVINHVITVEELRQAETKKTACYDIDVEVDDTLKTQMNNFLLSTASQQEIQVRYLGAFAIFIAFLLCRALTTRFTKLWRPSTVSRPAGNSS